MVEADNINVTFGPAPQDRTTLSKPCRAALDAVFRHPLSHSLEWADLHALFTRLGSVERKANNEVVFAIEGEHHVVHQGHGKTLSADDVVLFRHMLTRAGWAPAPRRPAVPAAGEATAAAPDLMVVVELREARIYRLDIAATDHAAHVIRPHEPHHFLHHLSHSDQAGERAQRDSEDAGFYEWIGKALQPAGRIVVVGHGHGHSNAAQHLASYLRTHHADIFGRLSLEFDADLSSLTAKQLVALGRRALSAPRRVVS